jgi:hypothetical protein
MGLLVVVESAYCVRSFLCRFENRFGRDRIGQLHSREYVVSVVEKFHHAFARVAWIKLTDEDALDAFLD